MLQNLPNWDWWFKTLRQRLAAGKLSRREYKITLDQVAPLVEQQLTEQDWSNLMRRLDERSLGDFGLAIYDNTQRERQLAAVWLLWCLKRGLLGGVTMLPHGMESEGCIVTDSRHVNHDADYMLTVAESKVPTLPVGTYPVDVKFTPCPKFLTFKFTDLVAYVKKGAYALITAGNNIMVGPNGDPLSSGQHAIDIRRLHWWTVLTPGKMQEMMDREPSVERERYMGGKPTIQIGSEQFPQYLGTLYHWNAAN